jgi:hypothetical protein
MAYLSFVLGENREIASKPVTDDSINLNYLFLEQNHPILLNQSRNETRDVILKGIMPAPDNPIDPNEIWTFKDDYQQELIRFRNDIELFISDISYISDSNVKTQRINQFISSKQSEIDHIISIMKDRHWKVELGALVGAPAIALAVTESIAVGNIYSAMVTAYGGYEALRRLREYSEGKDLWEGQTIAYAVLTQQRFG